MVWGGYVLWSDLYNEVGGVDVLGEQEVRKKCIKCNGTGEVTDKFLALMTFGVSLLMDDKDKCPKCKGRGWVR